MNEPGLGAEGEEVPSPGALWQQEQDPDGGFESRYKKAVEYWDGQEASYNGVLGGFGFVSDIDVRDSRELIQKVLKHQFEEASQGKRSLVALDCGAGVGRVTKELLLHHFTEVDLLEPSQHLLETAEKDLKNSKKLKGIPAGHRAVNFYLAGLQQHVFERQRYTCIWIQWCLLYLTDEDVVTLFERAREGLQPGGLIMVKENICKKGFIVDKDDASVTRSNAYMLDLFEKANLSVMYNVKQRNFPKELFEVRMYALKPREAGSNGSA